MVTIRDVGIEDAEGIVAVLNPIIAARCYTALDALLSVEQQQAFTERLREGEVHLKHEGAVRLPGAAFC